MTKFSELNIKPRVQGMEGEKKQIHEVLNIEIMVHSFRIEESKFTDKGNGKCLWMQISINGKKHPLFSGSAILLDEIQRVPTDKFPFTTTIKKSDKRLEFT